MDQDYPEIMEDEVTYDSPVTSDIGFIYVLCPVVCNYAVFSRAAL